MSVGIAVFPVPTARSESRWAGRRALVTGAQGFIGSWLAERLLDEGARVVAVRRDAPAAARFRSEGIEDRCDVVDADVGRYDTLVRVVNEHSVDSVFHLAAQTIVGTAARSPLSTFEDNVRGTYNLLEACRTVGAVGDPVERIVVASSDKAYGPHEQLPFREETPLAASSPYDVSKACADMIGRCYGAAYGLPVAVTRLANVYGGGDLNFSRIVPDVSRALAEGKSPVLRSGGRPEREFLYVRDAVDAYLAVADSLSTPELRGRAWNVGTGERVSVMDLTRRPIAISGHSVEPDIRGSGTPPGEIERQHLDSSAIRRELGWSPRWDLEAGLRETYGWYERFLKRGGG